MQAKTTCKGEAAQHAAPAFKSVDDDSCLLSQVLEKGLPEEAIPGIKGKQVPLPIECKAISGLLNSQGVKVCWITS